MKKYDIYIALAALGGAGYWLITKKKQLNLIEQFEANARELHQYFPAPIIQNMERIYRIETANFTSKQFLKTYSPGMESFGASRPWGWVTVNKQIWNRYNNAPIGKEVFTENRTGIKKTFLKFRNLYDAMLTVCGFLYIYNNNPARWFSTNLDAQKVYAKKLKNFRPTLTENLT